MPHVSHTCRSNARHVHTESIGQVVLWVLVFSSATIREYLQHAQLRSQLCLCIRVRRWRGVHRRSLQSRGYLSTSTREWRNDIQLHIATLSLKQAFDRGTIKLLRDAMLDSAIRTVLAAALLLRTSGWQLASVFSRDRGGRGGIRTVD